MIQRSTTFARARRPLCGLAALLCFALAIVLTPSDVRSQLNAQGHDALADTGPPVALPLAAVAPAGDAFAPRATVDDDPRPAIPMAPPIRLPALPPGALRMPQIASQIAPVHVTAIATGSTPTAVVESNGVARVVTVGDSIDGSSITAIDDGGIRLAGGRRLFLEPGDGRR